MYFPYLRGRQFELIALREFAQENYGSEQKVIPIIEPVKLSVNSLKIAIGKFKKFDFSFSLVLNPKVGELEGRQDVYDLLKEDLIGSKWHPAFIVTPSNSLSIKSYIEEADLKNIILILGDSVDLGSQEAISLIKAPSIEAIVSQQQRIKRKIRGIDKKIIRLNDCFHKQNRNADYKELGPELFTEEHLFFDTEGFNGFSDYTVVSSEFTEGGTSPYAVVIHLTYQNEEDEIWIRHFTSESNEGQENVQGKFAEAVRKAVLFLNDNEIHTLASDELRKYFSEEKYPGLGMVKKISIKNHLELIQSIT
ncbi:sce7725 family protein [Lentimicrobium sp. S6]|uniref:sce7725 family protein n=1 Tax=Lentimicrobium sp. S6 TaxID=2735872 RepID=UPI00155423D6|nr:sce7725 family protein [Lentimicrobium sp. S6]NPD47908.1 sce7725 family protein [Lentimicrobium sp. S6]